MTTAINNGGNFYPFPMDLSAFTNLRLNHGLSTAITMAARSSLLIESSLTTSRSRHVIGKNVYKNGSELHCNLPEPIKIPATLALSRSGYMDVVFVFSRFKILIGASVPKAEFGQAGRIRLAIDNQNPLSHISGRCNPLDFELQDGFGGSPEIKCVVQKAIAIFNCIDTCDLLLSISRHNTAQKVHRFYGSTALPYAPLKLPSSRYNWEWFDKEPRSSTITHSGQEFATIDQIVFKNEFGEVEMLAIKCFDVKTQSVFWVPVSALSENHSPHLSYHCVGQPKQQPLLHIPEIINASKVIITDDPGIAAANQKNAPNDIAWTSFLCDPGEYDQVNWTPRHSYLVVLNCYNHFLMNSEHLVQYDIDYFDENSVNPLSFS